MFRSTENEFEGIQFTLLYFKMAVIPLVLETKIVDVSKLISLKNLLVSKIMWFVLTTMSTTLILSRTFGADRMTRIANIYSHLPRTHSLHFDLQRQHTHSLSLSLSLHFDLQRQHTLSLSLSLSLFILTSRNSFTLPVSKTQINTRNMGAYTFSNFFLCCSAFSVRFVPASNTASEISTNPKETNNQRGRRHIPPRIHCYISVYWYLAWNT